MPTSMVWNFTSVGCDISGAGCSISPTSRFFGLTATALMKRAVCRANTVISTFPANKRNGASLRPAITWNIGPLSIFAALCYAAGMAHELTLQPAADPTQVYRYRDGL